LVRVLANEGENIESQAIGTVISLWSATREEPAQLVEIFHLITRQYSVGRIWRGSANRPADLVDTLPEPFPLGTTNKKEG
jgi:hypothetical protein